MKIAVYGISRSGKDYFISHLLQSTNKSAIHVKGSTELRKLSNSQYHVPFNELSPTQKENIRKIFIDLLSEYEKEYEYVFVDGHYSFPNGENGFHVVMTDEDLQAYETFIYLQRPVSRIQENAKTDPKHAYFNYLMDERRTEEWIQFDCEGLSATVKQANKQLFVIDTGWEESETFFQRFLQSPFEFRQESIADAITKKIVELFPSSNHVVLIDCDKTLCIGDTTKDILISSRINPQELKNIFKNDAYTIFQFFRLHEFIKSVPNYHNAVQYAAAQAVINENLLHLLRGRPKNCVVVGITSGSMDVWSSVDKQYRIFDFLVGKGCFEDSKNMDALITPIVKRLVAIKLRSLCIHTSAIGDSIIDIGMLESSENGYLVANEKLDKRIVEYFSKNQGCHIVQFSSNMYKYYMVPEVEIIKW